MRVLVTGAYGLIGSACLARLHRDGHQLIGAGRSVEQARRRFPYAHWIKADFAQLTTPQAWQPLLAGVDAVVNCVGVLQDSARDDTHRIHVDATVALFGACVQAGIHRVIHMSAIGAEREGPSAFSRTKAEAEARLASLVLDWVILRPALVMAPGVYGGTAVLRGLAAMPGVIPLLVADSRIQIVSVDDVAETVALSLQPNASARVIWELAHSQVLTLERIVLGLRAWLGFAPRRVLRLPPFARTIIAGIADALGWFGWRSPARSTSLAQLEAGVVGDPLPWTAATGIRPQSFDDILASRPANVQERWFARLYLLKPLAIAALALTWIVPAAFSLWAGWNTDPAYLRQAIFPTAFFVVEAVLGMVVGIAVLNRPTACGALIGMLLIVGARFLLAAALPAFDAISVLAAFIHAIPMTLATLFTLAILDDR